jgi:hypothetical protein
MKIEKRFPVEFQLGLPLGNGLDSRGSEWGSVMDCMVVTVTTTWLPMAKTAEEID